METQLKRKTVDSIWKIMGDFLKMNPYRRRQIFRNVLTVALLIKILLQHLYINHKELLSSFVALANTILDYLRLDAVRLSPDWGRVAAWGIFLFILLSKFFPKVVSDVLYSSNKDQEMYMKSYSIISHLLDWLETMCYLLFVVAELELVVHKNLDQYVRYGLLSTLILLYMGVSMIAGYVSNSYHRMCDRIDSDITRIRRRNTGYVDALGERIACLDTIAYCNREYTVYDLADNPAYKDQPTTWRITTQKISKGNKFPVNDGAKENVRDYLLEDAANDPNGNLRVLNKSR